MEYDEGQGKAWRGWYACYSLIDGGRVRLHTWRRALRFARKHNRKLERITRRIQNAAPINALYKDMLVKALDAANARYGNTFSNLARDKE